jgi:hypothetical protein
VTTHVAVDDCERIRPGLVAQPVNTMSSLAYCAAGAWVLLQAPMNRPRLALGAAAVAAGLGSALYHGPGGQACRRLHDGSAVLLTGAIAASLPRRPTARRAATVGCLLAGSAVHAASRSGRPLCRPDSIIQGHALWHVLTAAAVVLAAG